MRKLRLAPNQPLHMSLVFSNTWTFPLPSPSLLSLCTPEPSNEILHQVHFDCTTIPTIIKKLTPPTSTLYMYSPSIVSYYYSYRETSEANKAELTAANTCNTQNPVHDGNEDNTGSELPLRHCEGHHNKSKSPKRHSYIDDDLYERDVQHNQVIKVTSNIIEPTNDERRDENFHIAHSDPLTDDSHSTNPHAHERSSELIPTASSSCYIPGAKPVLYPPNSILITHTMVKQAKPQHMDYVGPSKTVLG